MSGEIPGLDLEHAPDIRDIGIRYMTDFQAKQLGTLKLDEEGYAALSFTEEEHTVFWIAVQANPYLLTGVKELYILLQVSPDTELSIEALYDLSMSWAYAGAGQ